MEQGYLSRYFKGVASKRLRVVEVNPKKSNQHEFNGNSELKRMLGEPDGKQRISARFMYFSDASEEPIFYEGHLTWYDARAKGKRERGVNRKEYRLYFTGNDVMKQALPGDLLFVAILPDHTSLVIIAANGSSFEQQLAWLFGVTLNNESCFTVRTDLGEEKDKIGLSAGIILEQIGIELKIDDDKHLEIMLQKFDGGFPVSTVFSNYARSTLRTLKSRDDPDFALVEWMEREEVLYRILERHLLKERLKSFIEKANSDPEQVIKIVQSTLQRRRSRAGHALENHLEQIFCEHNIKYTRGGVTENKLKPDFIFPGINEYHNINFPDSGLVMLAVKSTCKDRWRQILNEAERIPFKHLLTLEPGISVNQTDEMKSENVRLVIPRKIQASYRSSQHEWLMSLQDFIHETYSLQRRSGL